MVLSTSDEATIISIYEITLMGLPCWQLTLDNGGAIPVPKNPAAFKAQLDELKKTKQHGKYWLLKELVAEVTYAYALTGHRAQGSTYRYAFVDVADLARCKGMARTVDGDRVYEFQSSPGFEAGRYRHLSKPLPGGHFRACFREPVKFSLSAFISAFINSPKPLIYLVREPPREIALATGSRSG
jgi:hypothetical protein